MGKKERIGIKTAFVHLSNMPSPVGLTPNALLILEKRYLQRDSQGRTWESPEQMFRRVAKNIASVSEAYGDRQGEEEEFFQAMMSLEFLPNSPTLMNAGTNIQQLSACFVIPVEDSIESIYDAIKYGAIVQQTGGGTGYSFSRLRPEGDIVGSTGGVASGPVSFMKVFDAATEAIKQGGRRRGANMGVLRVDHPDIEPFIHAKDDLISMSNFNLSVAVTDQFMKAAATDGDLELVNPRTGQVVSRVAATRLLDNMAKAAWRSGDPGILFIDAVNRDNPTPTLGRIEATNPCGEVPLLPFEACNLGSINLDRMVEGQEINWEKLGSTVDMGIRFLDNVIDATHHPLPQTREVVMGNRKIGLGVMGFADLLIRYGIKYGSDASKELAEKVISFIRVQAETTSREIAESRGSFPNIDVSTVKGPRRNATLLSIAPTGTISLIAGCSSGIEPHYAMSYSRNVLGGQHMIETVPSFLDAAKRGGFLTDDLLRGLSNNPSIQGMEAIPPDMKEIFVTAHDVPVEDQIDLQAIFQKHVDNAVSKTINLSPEVTWKEVRNAFEYAFQKGCKGITVYREGSKPGQVLTTIRAGRHCPSCGRIMRGEEGAMQCDTCG